MQAIRIHQPGGPDVLQLETVARPRPGADEVLIQVAMAGVNYADIGLRRGMMGGPHSVAFPYIPGLEVTGVVAELGHGVTGFAIGQRVMAVPDAGGYAAYVVAPVEKTFAMPQHSSFAAGNALLVQGLTAYGLLHDAVQIQAGETVLVQAAAGGVGSMLVQLANIAGATVIGTASPEKLAFVRELGAAAAVDYTRQGWAKEVYRATEGAGVHAVIDGVNGALAAEAFACLAPFGRMVMYGATGGEMLPFPAIAWPMQMKALSISGFGGPWLRPGRAAAAAAALTDLVERGTLRPTVQHVYPLAEAAAAHAAIEARITTGKVVLQVDTAVQ